MDATLKDVAKDLIISLKLLEKEPEKLSSRERETYLARINKVLEMKLPINENISEGIFWVIVNCFTIPKFEEKERLVLMKLLKNLLLIIPEKESFISKKKQQEKFTMLLISKLLESLQV